MVQAQVTTSTTFFITSKPGAGCPAGYTHGASQWYCDSIDFVLPHVKVVVGRVSGDTIDTGTIAPNFSGYAAADLVFADYNGLAGPITNIVNAGNVTTVNMTGGNTFDITPTGGVCIKGNSNPAFNTCIQNITGNTYVANVLTSFTFAQTSPQTTGTGGVATLGCWTPIQRCGVEIIFQHHQAQGDTLTPPYVYGHNAWNDAQVVAWVGSQTCSLHGSVTHGGHFYHNLNSVGTASATDPLNWSTSGGTSVDGGCLWQDDGVTHALAQEASVQGGAYPGTGANVPTNFTGAGGGAVFNIDTTVGAGVGQCTPSACTTVDVASGFPVQTENSYKNWWQLITYGANDGLGNPGLLIHYANVSWASDIYAIRPGWFDIGEIFGFNQPVIVNSHWFNLTYLQYRASFIDDFVGKSAISMWAVYAGLNPPWKLESSTNAFSGCPAVSECLDYPTELLIKLKAASPLWNFGNQGLSTPDLVTNQTGAWATQNTGFWPVLFQKYILDPASVVHYLQPIANDCPLNGNQSHCTAAEISTGSMAQWLPFALQHKTRTFEFFNPTVMCTFDPNYVYPTVTTGPDFNDCAADNYAAAYANALTGNPGSTSSVQGVTSLKGHASDQ